MPTVSETLTDGVNPIVGAVVRIRLVSVDPQVAYADDEAITGVYEATTNGSGVWSAVLPANSTVNPSGTVYEVKLDGRSGTPRPAASTRHISVGTGGPYNVEDILTDPPSAAASSALQSHLDGHAELVRDTIGSALVAGSNVTITVNDAGDTITIAASGGGGSATDWSADTKTANYTLTTSDTNVLANTASGNVTLTLPTAVGSTAVYSLKKIASANTMTVATTSSQTIDGSTTIAVTRQYESITVVSDGANWHVI